MRFSTTPARLQTQDRVSVPHTEGGGAAVGAFAWDCAPRIVSTASGALNQSASSPEQHGGWFSSKRRRTMLHSSYPFATGPESSSTSAPDSGMGGLGPGIGAGLPSDLLDKLAMLYPSPQQPVTFFANPCSDNKAFVPIVTCGTVYLLLKQGARLDEVPDSIPPMWNRKRGVNVWEAGSLLYGKLVMWVSRDAARRARRREGHPSPSHQQRHNVFATKKGRGRRSASADAEDSLQEAVDSGLHGGILLRTHLGQAADMARAIWNLATQQSRGWEVVYEADPPARPRFWGGRLRLPWNLRGQGGDPDAEADGPTESVSIPWLEAVGAELWYIPGVAPSLLEVPLAHAVSLMEDVCIQQLPHSFTLGPAPDEVIPHSSIPMLGGPKLQRGAQVPAFTIPGVWAILPTAKGFVKVTPHFLSKRQLLRCWEAVVDGRARHVLKERKQAREKSLASFKVAVINWADKVSGTTVPPVSSSGAVSGGEQVSDSEPSELSALLQQLGYSPEHQKPQARRQLKGPLSILPITVCGGLLTAAHFIHHARNRIEGLMITSLGRKLALGLPRRPHVQTRPLAELVAEVRRHNAAVLAEPGPVGALGTPSGPHVETGGDRQSGRQPVAAGTGGRKTIRDPEAEGPVEGPTESATEEKAQPSSAPTPELADEDKEILAMTDEAFDAIQAKSSQGGIPPGGNVTKLKVQIRALELLRNKRELALFLGLLSKAMGVGSGRGRERWQSLGSGCCPQEPQYDCFSRSLATSLSDFVGWGLWQLMNPDSAAERAAQLADKWHQVAGRTQWVIQLPGDYMELEGESCGMPVEGRPCYANMYCIAGFDGSQAIGGRATIAGTLGDDLLRGIFLMGDLDLGMEEGALMSPLDLAVINAPHLDQALDPWP